MWLWILAWLAVSRCHWYLVKGGYLIWPSIYSIGTFSPSKCDKIHFSKYLCTRLIKKKKRTVTSCQAFRLRTLVDWCIYAHTRRLAGPLVGAYTKAKWNPQLASQISITRGSAISLRKKFLVLLFSIDRCIMHPKDYMEIKITRIQGQSSFDDLENAISTW